MFCLNPEANGGLDLTLKTNFYVCNCKEKPCIHYSHELMLGKDISCHISRLTPETLRQLADELEKEQKKAKEKLAQPCEECGLEKIPTCEHCQGK